MNIKNILLLLIFLTSCQQKSSIIPASTVENIDMVKINSLIEWLIGSSDEKINSAILNKHYLLMLENNKNKISKRDYYFNKYSILSNNSLFEKKNSIELIKLLKMADKYGHPNAGNLLFSYYTNDMNESDFDNRYLFLESSANNGDSDAQLQIALLSKPFHNKYDQDKGIKYLKLAAIQGNFPAISILGGEKYKTKLNLPLDEYLFWNMLKNIYLNDIDNNSIIIESVYNNIIDKDKFCERSINFVYKNIIPDGVPSLVDDNRVLHLMLLCLSN